MYRTVMKFFGGGLLAAAFIAQASAAPELRLAQTAVGPISVAVGANGPSQSVDASNAGNGSLSLPAGSSALSPADCTNIYHPTLRLFVRNTGSPSSHLLVQALYPGLLGGVQTATIAPTLAAFNELSTEEQSHALELVELLEHLLVEP